jgi:triosephosphate isomerase
MRPLIVANWKMNPQILREAKQLFNSVKKGLKNIKNTEVVICPPFVYLLDLQQTTNDFSLGAQDCFWEKAGAFTSGISAFMLKDIGCRYVILGHSERRIYFGDTDEIINKKIKAAILAELNPIFCIGETEREKENGKTWNVLKNQLEKGLSAIPEKEMEDIALAYEPVWAIGTGDPCSPEETQKIILSIREIISEMYSRQISENLRILYGGSVNSGNVKDYIIKSGVNGFIIGGASINPKEFIKIVRMIGSS